MRYLVVNESRTMGIRVTPFPSQSTTSIFYESSMPRPLDKKLILGFAAAVLCGAGLCLIQGCADGANAQTKVARQPKTLENIPFDGKASYEMLQKVCAIGPRISGTAGMTKQQELLKQHFTELGGAVSLNGFQVRDPRNGQAVKMANLFVEWHPERKQRILLCAHYDTRPFPDRDPVAANRTKPFIGANDGGSGVALLAEMGRHMKDLKGPIGIDFVLFDGEEYVFKDDDRYFLGSTFFAEQYRDHPPEHQYKYGILVDMIGDADLQIFQERHSMKSWRETRNLVLSIWKTAENLGVREFVPRPRHEVLDDHIPLNRIAKIPTCDIIDFDYPNPRASKAYWHTTKDTADKCSPLSLAKVGWVLLEWLKQVEAQQPAAGK